ncbi:mammalian cell entry protein [Nocardia nova]|uniref:Mammalian cell entry protein n=1 Tax=Nocardia nova TaxID=37330 RepID=A0A2S6AMS8_9NOCA|nr:MCE family protein [Nocardia nova]PPJ36528.1 mammalian cell entry protein [Nocardia nova]
MSTTARNRGVRLVSGVLATVVLTTVSGCGWRGLNSLPLPGTAGGGPGSYEIRAQLPDVVSVQQNSRVRVGDVTVGNVTKIEREDWHALVTMRLNGDVHLPANATAKVGQTSLLGSMHIELAPPAGEPPSGELTQGSLIPLDHAGDYPTTEQTLASLSVVLNGGGLGQLQEINQTLAKAFSGRENDVRGLLGQLDTFLADLTKQSDDIIAATASLDRLTGQIAAQKPVLETALNSIPQALAVLADQRRQIADAVVGIGNFSAIAADAVNQSKDALVGNLQNLVPVLDSLADAGPALTRSLSYLATYPWPKETLSKWMRGDYANLTGIIDLTMSRLDSSLFVGTPLEGRLTGIEAVLGRTVGVKPSPATRGNPLTFPYHGGP